MSTRTSLFHAIETNDILTVNYLIESDTCDFNVDNYGVPPLQYAVEWDQTDMVRSLLAHTECDVNIQSNWGYTSLHVAVLYSEKGKQAVRCLLDHPTIDVNIQDDDGYTPLHRAVEENKIGIVRCLLARPECDVNIQDNRSRTPLYLAVLYDNITMLKCLFDETTCSIVLANNDGDTFLHLAVKFSNIEMVRYLQDKTKCVDEYDNDGDTPLHIAVQYSKIEIVRYLLDQTERVNIQNNKGETLLHKAVWSDEVQLFKSFCWIYHRSLSIIEIEMLNIEVINCILDQTDCDVNVQNNKGYTPLHIAVQKSNIPIVRCLIEHTNCNVNIQDSDGNTPLYIAVQKGTIETVRCILDRIDVNIKNQSGYSQFSTTGGLHVDNQLQLVTFILSKNDFQSLWVFFQNGLYINSLTSSGENMVHLLSQFYMDYLYIDFSFLLHYGLDFNLINTVGNSTLMVASILNNLPFIQFLADLPCDVNRQNHQGHTALHLCVIGFTLIKEKLNRVKVNSVVKELCSHEYYPRYLACRDTLLKLGADVNMQDNGGKTVLMLACLKNDKTFLETLLLHGADVNIVDNHGRSALQYIDLTNNVYDLTCFNLLLSHGCRQSFNQPWLNGNTIIQNVLKFTPLWQINDIVNFIKFLVFKNAKLQLLTSDDGEISYGQLSLEEFSSESRQELRKILYLSGGSFVQITQILHFEVEEKYEASLPKTVREKPREKFYLFANNLSLKEMCRRVIRQNTGLAIHDRISELLDSSTLTNFLILKDLDSEPYSLPVHLEYFIDDDYDDDYNFYDLNKENDDYENDYLMYIDCKYLNEEAAGLKRPPPLINPDSY